MTQVIYNSLKSSDLDVIALSSPDRVTSIVASSVPTPGAPPVQVESLIHNVAEQINTNRAAFQPSFRAVDLEKMITDVIVETSVQGASLLEIHLVDPYWTLFRRNEDGWCFIDVDPNGDGFLWPPIEVNFPPTVSDATWRLCQAKPTTELSAGNVILTFEDKIVAEMREHTGSGPNPTDPALGSSNQNETRAEFIRRCVKQVSKNPLLDGEVGIRFWPLFPPNTVFSSRDLIGDELTTPASATAPSAPAHRQNFTKASGITTEGKNATQQTIRRVVGGLVSTVLNEISLIDGTLNGKAPSDWSPPRGPQPGS